MTEIRVNSVLPIANVGSVQSSQSGSDFAFSFQSVSAADLGSEASASRKGTSIDSANQTAQTAASTVKSPERADSGTNQSVAQSSGSNSTDFERAHTVSTGSDTVQTKQNSSVDTSDDHDFQITISGNAEQTVQRVGNELSELQNQAVKTDSADSDEETVTKSPMLNLDRIIERLESSLIDSELRKNSVFSSESEDNETEDAPIAVEQVWQRGIEDPRRAILHNSEENAPIIDLDRILAGLRENEQTELTGASETVESAEPTAEAKDDSLTIPSTTEIDSDQTVDEKETAALPQINFDKILESVKGVQDGDEVAPSADVINAAEAEDGVNRSEAADDDRIAANVGLVWNNLADVVAAAWESLLQTDLLPSDVPLRNIIEIEFEPISEPVSVQDITETDEGADRYTVYDAILFNRFARALSQEETPTTLEELRAKLANAMMIAISEMNDPDKQQEELEEKILEFLLKFLEKMNEDEDEKETTLDSEKNGEDMGILLLIIENLIDELREARDSTEIADSEENALEIAPTAAAPGVKTEYGVNVEANANKFTNTDTKATGTSAESKTEHSISGAAEGLYTSVADVNADVNETQGMNISEAYESLTVTAVPMGLSKVDASANDDDLDAKAAKVLSKQNRNGTIREPELPDEFAELRKLIDDMKKTHEDEEEPEEEKDDEEKEVGVGGKGVKGDDKSEIIRAISIKSSEPGEAAVAKSFSMERSGAKQILSQIAAEVLNNMPKEKRTVALVMTLTPETLGKVTLKITEQAGKLNVVVTAHNKETAEILASRMDGLQEALKDSGTQLEKYQVVYGPEQESDARQQSFDGSSKNPYVRNDDEEGKDKDGEFAELLRKAV